MKKELSEPELTPWDVWIIRMEKSHNVIDNNYDKLCELVVQNYNLKDKTRKADFLDLMTFFVKWWYANKRKMSKYKSLTSIGYLLGKRDHATIIHHLKYRKVTYKYDENTADIKDFLES